MKILQEKIGYFFKNPALLIQALTHSSYSHEKSHNAVSCNERLEFLGDAVLELTISDYLYCRYPAIPEGELTRKRASLVCEASLSVAARECGLGKLLRLGNGETQTGGFERASILSDAVEAVFGAVYVDGGIDCARAVILKMLSHMADDEPVLKDYKSTLQELLQKGGNETAVYSILSEGGPSHNKEFTALVTHRGKKLGTGTGKNKKEAEQNAAKEALAGIRQKR